MPPLLFCALRKTPYNTPRFNESRLGTLTCSVNGTGVLAGGTDGLRLVATDFAVVQRIRYAAGFKRNRSLRT